MCCSKFILREVNSFPGLLLSYTLPNTTVMYIIVSMGYARKWASLTSMSQDMIDVVRKLNLFQDVQNILGNSKAS